MKISGDNKLIHTQNCLTSIFFNKKELYFDRATNILSMFVKISDFLRHRSAVQLGLMAVIKTVAFYLIAFFILQLIFLNIFHNLSWAASDNTCNLFKTIETDWGGQIRLQGAVSWQDKDSIYAFVDEKNPNCDADVDFRLKNTTYFTDHIYSTIHYENVIKGGEIQRKLHKLKRIYADSSSGTGPFTSFYMGDNTINDDKRFFNLTKIIKKARNYSIYHRLDRFSLTFNPRWGMIRIGRQSVTWGNGLIFNPMDLFNPFAPTDIIRDYKIGDDMIYSEIPLKNTGNLQFLYVPGRNDSNGHITYSSSSAAGKLHISFGTTEFDIMAAHHFDDFITGLGSTGYFMNAAWRVDATVTFTDRETDFISLVANMDYSWVWLNKNIYGFMEFYFNGAGKNDTSAAMSDPLLVQRLMRGDIFFPGRMYFATGTQIEINPLVNFYFTMINNIYDYSCIFQPRILWDITGNLQFTLGGNFYCGGKETEFGGFTIQNTDYIYSPLNSIYVWWTYYF